MSASESKTRVAAWLKDTYVDLHQDPDFLTEDIAQEVALQIARAMDEAGFESQKAFAEHLGVTPAAVSQLLSGRENLSINRLVKVALALGKTVEPPKIVDYEPPHVESVEERTYSKTIHLNGVPTSPSPYSNRSLRGTSPKIHVCGDPLAEGAASSEKEAAVAYA